MSGCRDFLAIQYRVPPLYESKMIKQDRADEYEKSNEQAKLQDEFFAKHREHHDRVFQIEHRSEDEEGQKRGRRKHAGERSRDECVRR